MLTAGTTAFQPGLLAAAHRGVLYVDEVNLLHDHLVDLLLDAAALGVNYVEREGVSVRHASRFLLVGTMNPEEGELRPQLLDRFGLTVQVTASQDPAERAEVVRRRLAFEADPAAFARRFAADTAALAGQVAAARARLPRVDLPDAALRQICAVCGAFGVDGMRADLVTARTAIALAAWHGRDVVTEEDIRTRPGWRCRTAAAATPSTPPAWTSRPWKTPCVKRPPRVPMPPAAPKPTRTAPMPGPAAPSPQRPRRPRPRRPQRPRPVPAVPAAPRAPAQAHPPRHPASAAEAPPSAAGVPGGPVPRPAADRARRRRGRARPPLRGPRPVRPHVGARFPQEPPLALHLPATLRAAALRPPHAPPPSPPP